MPKPALNSTALDGNHRVVELRRSATTAAGLPRMPAPGSAATDGQNALSDALRAIRLTGAAFLNTRLSSPFSVVIKPDRFKAAMPFAHLRQVCVFHLIVSGSCILETEDGVR